MHLASITANNDFIKSAFEKPNNNVDVIFVILEVIINSYIGHGEHVSYQRTTASHKSYAN